MSYCPHCISFRVECSPEPGDYDKPCTYFKSRVQSCSVCGADYDIDVGCLRCERGHSILEGQ